MHRIPLSPCGTQMIKIILVRDSMWLLILLSCKSSHQGRPSMNSIFANFQEQLCQGYRSCRPPVTSLHGEKGYGTSTNSIRAQESPLGMWVRYIIYQADCPFKVGMDEEVNIHIPPDIFLMLWDLPDGVYGVSYDIFTWLTEDNIPHGWNADRGEFRNSCESPWLQVLWFYSSHV